MDRALTHVGATCDLPLAEFLLEVQPQDLLDLSHGLSLSGQLRSALLGPTNDHPWLKSTAAIFPFSFHSDHCSPCSITLGRCGPKLSVFRRSSGKGSKNFLGVFSLFLARPIGRCAFLAGGSGRMSAMGVFLLQRTMVSPFAIWSRYLDKCVFASWIFSRIIDSLSN